MAGTENNQLPELSDSTYLSGDHSSFNVMEGQDDDSILLEEQRGGSGSDPPLREQDRFLPIANVARIMKHAVPKNGKIAKDAKECVQECVSEFISFITSEASERCHQEKRKTINGEDILFAMSTLGFDNYVEPLKVYLQKYRESCKSDKSMNAASEYFVSEMPDDINTLSRSILEDSATQNMVYYQDAGAVPQLNFG